MRKKRNPKIIKNIRFSYKRILSLVLAVLIFLTFSFGLFISLYQAKPKINDYTNSNSNSLFLNNSESSGDNTAVINPNVKLFVGDNADTINKSIKKIECAEGNIIITFDSKVDGSIKQLGKGDIFYLEASKETAFGETYIGKVVSVYSDKSAYIIVSESPTIDEVFDEMHIEIDDYLNRENIQSIYTAEGVTATLVDSLKDLSADNSDFNVRNMTQKASYTSLVKENTQIGEGLLANKTGTFSTPSQNYVFDLNVDITKLVEMVSKKISKPDTSLAPADISPTAQEPKDEIDEAIDSWNADASATLTGKFGIEDFKLSGKIDFNLQQGGFENLYFNITGKEVLEAELDLTIKDFELKGKTTSSEVSRFVKLSGLDEKLIPLAFLNVLTMQPITALAGSSINDQITVITSAAPISIGVMFYIDLNGNISAHLTFDFSYNTNFNANIDIIRDGKACINLDSQASPEVKWKTEFVIKADADIHVGLSALIYFYNINILDAAITKIGANGEGKIGIAFKGEKIDNTTSLDSNSIPIGGYKLDTEFSGYFRLYLKLVDVNVKLKLKMNFNSLLEEKNNKNKASNTSSNNSSDTSTSSAASSSSESSNVSTDSNDNSVKNIITSGYSQSYLWSFIWKDYTIWELGNKNKTHFDESKMSYGKITAQDGSHVYYKDEYGRIVSEETENGYKNIIYNQKFFSFCGIDSSYIYILRESNESNLYDVCRVAKDGQSSKAIISSVIQVLSFDDQYIYYVEEDDKTCVFKLNRENLKREKFYDFEYDVTFMYKDGNTFFIVTADNSSLFSFFTGPDYYRYVVSKDGTLLLDYGTMNLEPLNLVKEYFSDYVVAYNILSDGYLRETADDVYWLSSDYTFQVKTETNSGWVPREDGIFTTADNDNTAQPNKIILYKSADGAIKDITAVNNSNSIFTLCKDTLGYYYFFDQTDSQLILYKLSKDFKTKNVEKTFELSEISCDLSECNMEIRNNRLYFYTMPNSSTSKVLYRYDLY